MMNFGLSSDGLSPNDRSKEASNENSRCRRPKSVNIVRDRCKSRFLSSFVLCKMPRHRDKKITLQDCVISKVGNIAM
jgi:hypothetical protein